MVNDNLPRLLLKGFSSRIEGEEHYTWVYRKNANPFETNIINVGVSKGFYSKEQDISVDDTITYMEGEFATDLDKIRQFDSSTLLKNTKIAEFASHMEIRTRHLRDSFLESSDAFVSEFIDFLRDTTSVKQFLLSEFQNKPSLIKNALESQLKGKSLPSNVKKRLYKIVSANVPNFLKQFEPYINLFADYLAEELPKRIPNALKDGHLRALKENSVHEVRKEKYQRLQWKVYVFEQDDLILGDCGVIFEVDSSRRFKTFWEEVDKLKGVFLPISSKHLIIGSQIVENLSLELKTINRAIAECSREFFISKNSGYEFQNLQSMIGTNSHLMTNEEISNVFKEIISGYNQK